MNELIRVQEKNGNQLVSARELHEFLEAGSDVPTWFKNQVDRAMLIENEDFTQIIGKSTGGRPSIDYAISINSAKEIAMLNGGEKGKQARMYFIDVEKRYREQKSIDFSDPNTVVILAQNWKEERDKRLEIEKQKAIAEKTISNLKPKADVYDKVMDTDTLIDIGQVAKVLKLPFGRNKLFEKLREMGVFFKNRNEPKQQFVDAGYFILNQQLIEPEGHQPFVVLKVRVTQRGMAYIGKQFNAEEKQSQLAMFV